MRVVPEAASNSAATASESSSTPASTRCSYLRETVKGTDKAAHRKASSRMGKLIAQVDEQRSAESSVPLALVEEGEEPGETTAREVREETGLRSEDRRTVGSRPRRGRFGDRTTSKPQRVAARRHDCDSAAPGAAQHAPSTRPPIGRNRCQLCCVRGSPQRMAKGSPLSEALRAFDAVAALLSTDPVDPELPFLFLAEPPGPMARSRVGPTWPCTCAIRIEFSIARDAAGLAGPDGRNTLTVQWRNERDGR
jgi:NUDIX domain-containing protein